MKKKINIYYFPLLLLLLITGGLFSCVKKQSTESEQEDKIRVVASFSILSEMITAIGGDRVIVHNLVPVGTDPHEYEPRPDDIKFASRADLFFYNGLNLEGGEHGWFKRLVNSLNISIERIINASGRITPLFLSATNKSDEVNPHAFTNPKNGILMAEVIRDALIAFDPVNSPTYNIKAEEYIKKLLVIEQQYRTLSDAIAEEDRVLVLSEQAFQYMANSYGFKEGFIWSIDTDENGSPDQIKNAVKFVKTHTPPVLFVESNVDRRPMQTVSSESGVPLFDMPLYSDELSKPGGPAATYVAYLEYNIQTIHRGLTGH